VQLSRLDVTWTQQHSTAQQQEQYAHSAGLQAQASPWRMEGPALLPVQVPPIIARSHQCSAVTSALHCAARACPSTPLVIQCAAVVCIA
jgi:hypothetical protein